MAIRNIRRQATNPQAAPGTPNAAPIYVDLDDNILKMIPAGSGTTEVDIVDVSSAQTLTNKTLTAPVITNAVVSGVAPVAYASGTSLTLGSTHQGRVVYVTDVASNYVLPAATGSGDRYTIVLGATQTGAGTIKTNAGETFIGNAVLFHDGGDTVFGASALAGNNTIDLLGTANSTGGMIGARYEFIDVATDVFHANIVSDAGGTEASPFSTV